MKRLLDLLLSLVALLVLLPCFLLIAFVIWLGDGGGVIFTQYRVGKKRVTFKIYKFRTMRSLPAKSNKSNFTAGDTSRVTPVGSFLRKYKLDELPQLFNVVLGDMSLVGPRPEVPQWVSAYPAEWDIVLTIRPGITDPASIAYSNEEVLLAEQEAPLEYYRDVILPRKLFIYQEYVKKQSLLYDFLLCIKTLRKVFF